MKHLTYLLWTLFAAVLATACSSDDPEVVADPVFPECIEHTLAPGETCEIKFEANLNWQLSTDKQWLKFVNGSGMVQALVGKAGAQIITLALTDGAQGFQDDQAVVELRMGNRKEVVARIIRTAKERVVKMYVFDHSENRMEVSELVDDDNFGEVDRGLRVGFEANFDWTVEMPEWMICESRPNGVAGEDATYNAGTSTTCNADLASLYTDREGTVILRALDSDYIKEFPVKAPGIEAGKIRWYGSKQRELGSFSWDDKGIQVKSTSSGQLEWLDEPVKCRAVVRDNKVTPHFVQWDSSSHKPQEVPVSDAWVKIEGWDGESLFTMDNGSVTLLPEMNTSVKKRTLYLFLLPEGVESVDYAEYFTLSGMFKFDLNGYGICLEQYGLSTGFGLWTTLGGYGAAVEKMGEATIVSEIEKNAICDKLHLVADDNIYEYSFTSEEWNKKEGDKEYQIHITPYLMNPWMGAFTLYDSHFNKLGVEPKGWATTGQWSTGTIRENGVGSWKSLNMNNRICLEDITEDCLYVVFANMEETEDVGTIVIRKKLR